MTSVPVNKSQRAISHDKNDRNSQETGSDGCYIGFIIIVLLVLSYDRQRLSTTAGPNRQLVHQLNKINAQPNLLEETTPIQKLVGASQPYASKSKFEEYRRTTNSAGINNVLARLRLIQKKASPKVKRLGETVCQKSMKTSLLLLRSYLSSLSVRATRQRGPPVPSNRTRLLDNDHIVTQLLPIKANAISSFLLDYLARKLDESTGGAHVDFREVLLSYFQQCESLEA